jgi:hypothetical protein
MKHTLIFFALLFAVTVSAQSQAQKAAPHKTNKCTFVNNVLIECNKPAWHSENRCKAHTPTQMRKQAAYGRMRRAKKH